MATLSFKGKTAIENHHHSVPHHVLEIDRKRSLSKTPSLEDNLIIEGDNLLALKSLLPTHAGRIACIYIDPPYNTGNERWIFNDNLTQPQFKEWIGREVGKEGEDATRHDKWCCMIYPRLQLLRELLRDDGAIFVSIDDNEVATLRLIMDEVFGAENFVATIARQTRISPDSDEKFITTTHDYVAVFAKNASSLPPFRLARSQEQDARYENPDNDPRGPWTSSDLTRREYRAHDYYEITLPSGRKVKPAQGRSWGVPKETFARLKREKRIWFGPDGNAMPRRKRFLSEVRGGIVPVSWWEGGKAGTNEDGRKEVNRVFAERPDAFSNPKPVSLIATILKLCTRSNSVVLDSFAGSGTTAHAVLALNKEDGGNRRFILVQQAYETKEQEKAKANICRQITAERVRRVIQGYGKRKDRIPGLGGSFTYARVGKVLLDEHRSFSRGLPSYEDLARYIFYTETSQRFEPRHIDKKTGRIGEHGGTSYYLLYAPNGKEGRSLDRAFLRSLKDKNPRKVVYCEKIWLHRDELREFGDVRPMLIPINLK